LAADWSTGGQWSREPYYSFGLISDSARVASALGWATVRVFGYFDDREGSADILAEPSLLRRIMTSATE
jgi:hypothetical protein